MQKPIIQLEEGWAMINDQGLKQLQQMIDAKLKEGIHFDNNLYMNLYT